jgi:hypothetical protein
VHLLAASGEAVVSVPLLVRSITVHNSLQTKDGTAEAGERVPPLNKVLNYFHSMCERFPVDDALSAVEAKTKKRAKRKVTLHMCSRALYSSIAGCNICKSLGSVQHGMHIFDLPS